MADSPLLKTPLERLQEYKTQGGTVGQALSFMLQMYPELDPVEAAGIVAQVFPPAPVNPPPAPAPASLPNIADMIAAMGQQKDAVFQNPELFPSFSEQDYREQFSEEPPWKLGLPIQRWWNPAADSAKDFTYQVINQQTGEVQNKTIPGSQATRPNIPPSALLQSHLLDNVGVTPVPCRLPLANEGIFEVGPGFFQLERVDIPGGLHFKGTTITQGPTPGVPVDTTALAAIDARLQVVETALKKVGLI